MRIVIDTDSNELYKDDYGCLVPFPTLTESEQNDVSIAIFEAVTRHNLCSRIESVEGMVKNQHRLIKSRIGVIEDTDTDDENSYRFCTKFNDLINIGAKYDTLLETSITTSIQQYTYERFKV